MSVENMGNGYVKVGVKQEDLEESIAGLRQLKPILQAQVTRGNGNNKRQAAIITKIALDLGYTPITTHLYLTQVLDDKVPMQRRRGLRAGQDILNTCGTIIIGARYGVSEGMTAEIKAAKGKNTIIIP